MPKFTLKYEVVQKHTGTIEVEADDREAAEEHVRDDIDFLRLLDGAADETTEITIIDEEEQPCTSTSA